MRSVPDSCVAAVSTASNPAERTTVAISRASVATTMRSQAAKALRRRTTRRTRGSPARSRSGLRGSRLEPSRAGITPRTGTGQDTKSVPREQVIHVTGSCVVPGGDDLLSKTPICDDYRVPTDEYRVAAAACGRVILGIHVHPVGLEFFALRG